jgi:hypothetical protein
MEKLGNKKIELVTKRTDISRDIEKFKRVNIHYKQQYIVSVLRQTKLSFYFNLGNRYYKYY